MAPVPHRLELREADPVGVLEPMDADRATVLAASGLVMITPHGATSWKVVPAGNKVGAVRIGDWELVVRPKAPFRSVLFMLVHALDPGIAPDEFEGSADTELWPMVAVTLERLCGRALALGVLQGYVQRADQLTVVRGRIRVEQQISRHQGRPLPLEVRYDEYETDIPENRILRTALHRMAQVSGVPTDVRGRIRRLEARLSGVALVTPGQPLPSWRANRLNRRYVPALRLAELVLEHLGLSTVHGDRQVASFVIDMAQAFERFVTASVAEAYGRRGVAPGGYTSAQFRTHLDTGHSQPIRPDIVHVGRDGIPDAVLDAKYKLLGGRTGGGNTGTGSAPHGATGTRTSGHGARLSDLYQMLAYCTVLGLDHGTLVYAAEDPTARPITLDVKGSCVRITAWPVDVALAPRELINSIARLIHGEAAGSLVGHSHLRENGSEGVPA